MALYKDPILDKLETLINANDGGAIKTFIKGDLVVVPKADLPALLLVKESTEVGNESNAEDYHKMNIVLTLIVDVRDYFEDTPRNVHVGDQKMNDVFEGRNSNFTLKTTAIIDILRKNANLTNNAHIDMEAPMNVSYDFTIGKRGPRTWSQEANLTISVYYTQLRN